MKKIILTLIAVFLLQNITAQTTYVLCGKLVDTKSGKIASKKTIIVKGNKILNVMDGYVAPKSANAITIDLKDKVVMPGLIDFHVHIEQEFNRKTRLNKYILNEADVALNSVGFAKTTLLNGFTTVRDLGGSGVNISVRNAINGGKIIGPRVFTAGKSLATTGGHADPTNGSSRALLGNPGPKEGVVNSIEDAKKAVRQRYKDGADGIKLTVTGGVLSVAKSGDNPQFTAEEVVSVVRAAKDYGMWVAVHAHGAEGMKRAVIAGVDSVEHGTFMTEEVMDLMIKNGTYYVPTISAGEFVAEKAKIDNYFPDIVRPKAASVGPQIAATFAKAYKRGVKIAFGTDAGVQAHGTNWREFVYMSENGMPAIETIKAATIETAKLLSIDMTHGSITVGKVADLVAVKGNPLDDMYLMQDISFVMKGGESVFFNR